MANYYGTARTSYFPIPEHKLGAFEEYIQKLPGVRHAEGSDTEDGVSTYCLINDDDCGFATVYIFNEDSEEDQDVEPIKDILDQFVEIPTAVYYVEAGAEKSRYIVGYVALYTRDAAGQVSFERDTSLSEWVSDMARSPLTEGMFQTIPAY